MEAYDKMAAVQLEAQGVLLAWDLDDLGSLCVRVWWML